VATYICGPHERFLVIPTSADTVKIEFLLLDSTAPATVKTGVAYSAATVTYCKPGEASFTAFPSFGTDNWAELGKGWYQLIIRGSVANELALLNTAGPVKFDVAATGVICPPICRTVVSASFSTLTAAQVNTEVDTGISDAALSTAAALTTVDGVVDGIASAVTTVDGIVDAIKLQTDKIPASPAAVGSQMALVDNAITAAKVDADAVTELQAGLATGAEVAALDSLIDAIKARTDLIPDDPAAAGDEMALTSAARTAILVTVFTSSLENASIEDIAAADSLMAFIAALDLRHRKVPGGSGDACTLKIYHRGGTDPADLWYTGTGKEEATAGSTKAITEVYDAT